MLLIMPGIVMLSVVASDPAQADPTIATTSSSFNRDASGYLTWNVAARIDGFATSDQPCNTSDNLCYVYLQAQHDTSGSVEILSTDIINGSGPVNVAFGGSLNTTKVTAWRIAIYTAKGSGSMHSSWVGLADPYATPAVNIEASSSISRLPNGYASYTVNAAASGFNQPDEVCGNVSYCGANLEFRFADGSVSSMGSADVAGSYPATFSFSGTQNLLKVTAWRVSVVGRDNNYNTRRLQGDWVSVVDPYSTPSVSIDSSSSLSRMADGYASFAVHGVASGYSQPDQACGTGTPYCYSYLEFQFADGSVSTIAVASMTPGSDYPGTFSFSGTQNLLEVTAWRVVIKGRDNSYNYRSLQGDWVAVADVYPAQKVTISAGSSYRDAHGDLHWSVTGRAAGYSQPDRVCASEQRSTCFLYLEGKQVDGNTVVLARNFIAPGSDYPINVSLDGSGSIQPLVAWRPYIFGQIGNKSFYGDWLALSDVSASERRGGVNAAENGCACQHADPVDSYSGAFNESVTDLSLAGVGPMVGASRTYSSWNATAAGAFGYGWGSNFEMGLSFPSASSVLVAQENGATVSFSKNADGSFAAPSRVIAILSYDSASSTYTYLRRGVEKFTFDSLGRLLSSSDLNGNTVTIGRDSSGHVVTLLGSGGRTVTVTWTGGVVTEVADSAGRSVSYSYNAAGELAGVTAADGAVTAYTYDSSHRVVSMTSPKGGVTTNTYNTDGTVASQTDPVGRTTSFAYGGGVTTIVKPSGTKVVEYYSGGVLSKQVIDADGSAPRTTTYDYDDSNNLLSTVDALGATTSATYDARGNVLTQTNALGKVSKFTYNALNEVLTSTDPLNRKTTATYNATGQQLTAVDPAGITKTWTHNADGTVASLTDQLGKVTTYTYDLAGRPTGSTDPDNRVRSVGYNAAGFVTTETDPAGKVTTTTRDAVGRPLTVQDPDGNTTTSHYDADGNLVKVTDAREHDVTAVYDVADQKTSSTDANGNTTRWTYAPNGQVKAVTDPRSNVDTSAYDTFDQLISVTDPGNGVTSFRYDEVGRRLMVTLPSNAMSSASYDAAGQIITTTDALGKVTRYAYDAAGQQVSSTDPLNRVTEQAYSTTGLPTVKTLPGNATEVIGYDAAGQQTSFTNADGLVTSYVWDPAGLLSSKTEPGTMTTSYSYDTAGRQRTVIAPDGHVTRDSYSDAGRLTRVHSDVTDSTDITYSWDANGNRASMTDATGTTSYTYDNGDRLTATTNGAGKAIGYGYDAADDLTAITYPGNKIATYTYDSSGRMTSLKDWANRTSNFTWSSDSQLLTQGYANGVTETRTYDAAGQLKQTQDVNAAGTALGTYGYGYDAAGQLTSDSSNDPLGIAVAHTYTYDTTSQLASIAGSGITGAVTASSGGRLTKAPTAGTLAYNTQQQVTSRTPTTGTATTYGYDSNGARINATTGSSSTTFGYSGFGDLDSVTLPTKTVTYTSDGDGLRQTRSAGGVTKQLLWNTNGFLPLLLDDGTQTYLYGPTGTPIAQVDSAGTIQYLHADLLGTPRLITSTTGAVIGATAYSAYGTVTSASGTATSAIGYTGNWTDPDSNLVYLRARDYDPTTGQFLQVDPEVDSTRQPYAYVGNSPLAFTDPTGCDLNDALYSFLTQGPGRNVASALTGFGDGASLGLSRVIREAIMPGSSCNVSQDGFYAGGQIAGTAATLALPGVGIAGQTSEAGRVAGLLGDSEQLAAGTRAELPGGYSSFSAAKRAMGSPGKGNVFDHVVEQSQIKRSGFAPEEIHNPFNMNPVSARTNQIKANYYSTSRASTGGGTIRDWLTGQSFADQYAFGMDVLAQIRRGTIQ